MKAQSRVLLCGMLGLALASCATAAEWRLGFESAEAIAAAGGRVHGTLELVDGRKGKAASFPEGSFVTAPVAGRFAPRQGSLELWVRPSWRGDGDGSHTFFHLQEGRAHVTLFKAQGGALRFAYRGTEPAWFGVDVSVRHWKPGEWHHVVASWVPMGDGSLLLALKADDAERFKVGAVPFADLPATLFIGSRGPRLQPAEAAIDELLLTDRVLVKPSFIVLGRKKPVVATIDASRPSGPLRRVHDFTTPWNSREVPLPFKEGDAYHRRFREAGFRLARLVAFSDTWLWGVKVERGADGTVELDFGDFDRLVDLVRSAGAEPYIRLAYNMPRALSSVDAADPRQRRKAAYAPPRSTKEWDALMRDIVRHCNVERKLGVRYFVCSLNEGDIAVRRGESDWGLVCELYERTVRVVREVDPAAKVGGPALAADPRDTGAEFMRLFLRFCAKRKLPLDFICFHGYRKGHPREYGEMLDAVKAMVAAEYPGLKPEYFLDEFNLWLRDKRQDNEYGAAYITAAEHFLRRAGIAKVSLVSFNHFRPATRPPQDIVSHRGPFDRTSGQAARFLARDLTAEGVARRGILAHSPTGSNTERYTFGRYDATVPAEGDPRLVFATGLAIKRYPKMDGVTFRVAVIRDGRATCVFDVHQRALGWQPREVSLRAFAGRRVAIEFRTSCGPPGSNTVADWGAWAEPRLVTGPAAAPTTAFDFVERIGEASTGARDPGYAFAYTDDTIRRYSGLPLLKGPVVTSPYFALKMHSLLKTQELPVAMAGKDGIAPDEAAGVLASGDTSGTALLLWTFDLGSKESRQFELELVGLGKAKQLALRQYLIDETHTNPYYDYVVAKTSPDGGRYNLERGKMAVVREERLRASDDGRLRLSVSLKPMAVSLLTLSKP